MDYFACLAIDINHPVAVFEKVWRSQHVNRECGRGAVFRGPNQHVCESLFGVLSYKAKQKLADFPLFHSALVRETTGGRV